MQTTPVNEKSPRTNRRRVWAASATAAAVVAVTVGIVALNPGRTLDAQPAAAGATDAGQALRDSVAALRAGNYTFTRSGAGFIADVQQGTAALPGGASIRHTETYAVARIGAETRLQYLLHVQPETREQYLEYWKKHATPAQQKKAGAIYDLLDGRNWVRADETKLTAAAEVDEQSGLDVMAQLPTAKQPDATGAGVLVAAVTTAERSGNVITGTLDATGQDPFLQRAFNDPAYLYGPAAKAMPFRATLDDQGRLTEFTVTMPSEITSQPAEPFEPTPPLVIKVSGYGETKAPSLPADAGELPAEAYDMLSNDTD
ncbi:hypothetical protein [Actinoplanes couchii]|uniref:DUF2092 domain-containing protein n=1 Tax=Actinoplanes couchii TaxID=403638 RepID=A0ABQ3XN42_9ACTN|nr:hypothetical protein [Actinoplanes couchii]MDR6318149.1 hypothetical protein [Actinoplanes couchii]GID59935.1 hypothetical protein Aco03nite_083390 [Actinoplanes couchii]